MIGGLASGAIAMGTGPIASAALSEKTFLVGLGLASSLVAGRDNLLDCGGRGRIDAGS